VSPDWQKEAGNFSYQDRIYPTLETDTALANQIHGPIIRKATRIELHPNNITLKMGPL
jgi:hypothetical protein